MLKSLEDERKEWLKKEGKADEKDEGRADPKAGPDRKDETKTPPKPLPAEITKAWVPPCMLGWMYLNDHGFLEFTDQRNDIPGAVRNDIPGAVPAFGFNWADGYLPKVPDPGVPFGLGLRGAISDDGMKEVARFKTLQALDLSYTGVTCLSLKELAGLKDLRGSSLGVHLRETSNGRSWPG